MSLNMMSLTLEQVLNKRHKLVQEMIYSMVVELRADYAGYQEVAVVAEALKTKLEGAMLNKPPEHFNNDDNFKQAVTDLLAVKSNFRQPSMLQYLDASDENVRGAALGSMNDLDPAVLALHASAIAARLEDNTWFVRAAAMTALSHLHPLALEQHARSVAFCLQDTSAEVRMQAVENLGRLQPEARAQQAGAIAARLGDANEAVRWAAVNILGRFPEMGALLDDTAASRLKDMLSGHSYTISIQTIDRGQTIILQVEPWTSIDMVKGMVQEKEGIHPNRQRLIFAGKVLKDGETLFKAHIEKNETVSLVLLS